MDHGNQDLVVGRMGWEAGVVLVLSGELDARTVGRLSGEVPGPGTIIDLSRLRFCDAAGMRRLVDMSGRGALLHLDGAPTAVRRVAALCGAGRGPGGGATISRSGGRRGSGRSEPPPARAG